MKKFLVLYCATQERLQLWSTMTQEEGEKEMAEWMEWQGAHESAMVDPGNPVGKNTRLTAEGATPVANEVCGYSILKGASKEEVLAILADNPHTKQEGTYLEVLEITEM